MSANHNRLGTGLPAPDVVRQSQYAIAEACQRFPSLCPNGLSGGMTHWIPQQIAVAIAALKKCQKTKQPTIGSYSLKHIVERAVGTYIANGDLIVAALHLGFTVTPYRDSPNVGIGVKCSDLRRLQNAARSKLVG
jgi:hypothetical protein